MPSAEASECSAPARSVSWMPGSAATKLCAGEPPTGEPPGGDESPAADPCQLSFAMPCRQPHTLDQPTRGVQNTSEMIAVGSRKVWSLCGAAQILLLSVASKRLFQASTTPWRPHIGSDGSCSS